MKMRRLEILLPEIPVSVFLHMTNGSKRACDHAVEQTFS